MDFKIKGKEAQWKKREWRTNRKLDVDISREQASPTISEILAGAGVFLGGARLLHDGRAPSTQLTKLLYSLKPVSTKLTLLRVDNANSKE